MDDARELAVREPCRARQICHAQRAAGLAESIERQELSLGDAHSLEDRKMLGIGQTPDTAHEAQDLLIVVALFHTVNLGESVHRRRSPRRNTRPDRPVSRRRRIFPLTASVSAWCMV